jgi:hypothetical protein
MNSPETPRSAESFSAGIRELEETPANVMRAYYSRDPEVWMEVPERAGRR